MKPKAFLAVALVAAIVTGAATAVRAAWLPDGYKAVEYIESTGGQYIDTGVAAKTTVKTVTRDEVTRDLDLTAETPVAHKVQPMATITKITNRYPWNGKIDVEYELSNLGSEFDPIVLVTKFTSGDIEVTKTNDLSDAELVARTARRTFDCRELFGEGKRDAEAQSSAKLVALLDYDYAVIDISGGANTNFYPVTYHKSAPTEGWNKDEYKTSKIVLYYVKEGSDYIGNQKTEQATTGFWIGVFPVTEAQYAKVMGSGDSTTKPQAEIPYTTLRGTDNPNATVTGDSFLKRLCDRTGLDGFDLPTESQWEIACRAGTTTDYYWGDSESEADKYMWYSGNSSKQTQGVGQKFPNAWGLYDMAGNVWEWCRDGDHRSLTVDSSADVCLDPEVGSYLGRRVHRGGSFGFGEYYGRSSNRNSNDAGVGDIDVGFRLSWMSFGASDWTTGPDFSFDTRTEKTISGTEAETLTYSGDDWGAGGTGVTVWYSLEGGAGQTLMTATDSGTVSWTPTLSGRYVFRHAVEGGGSDTAVFVVNGLPGREGKPWEVGEGVTAYVKDRVLYLQGEGEVNEFAGDAPWAEYEKQGCQLVGAYLPRTVTLPASVAATLPISVEGGAEPLPFAIVEYRDAEGKMRTASDVAVIGPHLGQTLKSGWYVACGTNELGSLTVEGEVNLILMDGAKLTAKGSKNHAGLAVEKGNTLTIYPQALGTGELVAQGGDSDPTVGTGNGGGSGIGGGYTTDGGAVTVNGGIITATGGGLAPGIGGGFAAACGVVTINGGLVKASGGLYSSGIGSGCYPKNGGQVTINGGTVVATRGRSESAIDIGCIGKDVDVVIRGGSVLPTTGTIEDAPVNGANAAVYCVTVNVEKVTVERLKVEGLEDYGTRDIYSMDGKAYLWLPNGTYEFAVDGVKYCAVVEDAPTTAVVPEEGSEYNPWKVGEPGHEGEVTAWTNGTGALVIEGTGAVGSMPWAENWEGITKLIKSEGVTGLEELVWSLPDLETVNGLTLDDFGNAIRGFVAADGFSAIEIKNGRAFLDVVVGRSDSLGDSAEWTPVATNTVEVPASGEQGFFIVSPLFYIPGTDYTITGGVEDPFQHRHTRK